MNFEKWTRILPLRLRSLFRREHVDAELDEELREHLERQTQENIARGMDPEEARYAALRSIGGLDQRKEECRDARRTAWLSNFSQDLRYGVRLLLKSPGFAVAAILTVALGIGATTAVFSVVYGVLLRPLPYPEPERLVNIWTSAPRMNLPRAFVGAANYRDWRAQSQSLEAVALVRHIGNFNITSGAGEPERIQGARITASLFGVLRVSPALGRPFHEGEEQDGREFVVILSDRLWARRFNRDPGIIGRTIPLNGQAHEVVGVMPPGFAYPTRDFELWVPLTVNPEDLRTRMGYNFLSLARLKPGARIEQAQSEMDTISARLEQQYPEANRGISAVLIPMLGDIVGDVRRPLFLLLGAVTGLLLIGCASLANLLIARAVSRSGELTLRAALGAHRSRLVLQSLTELLPLLAVGGIAGVVLANWILALMLPWLPANMPRMESIAISPAVLAFAAVALASTALAAGLWPALQVARFDMGAALRESLRGGSTSQRGSRARDALVIAQISVAALLCISAALLIRSFVAIRQIDPGFRTEGVATMHLAIPRAKYAKDAQVAEVCRRILERVERLPGVRAAGMVNRLPLGGVAQIGSVEVENPSPASQLKDPGDADPFIEVVVDWRSATPDYFRALGIPLKEGRFFTNADAADAPLVGLIDEDLARRAWPGESAIGRRFRIPVASLPWVTIVGVVGHLRHESVLTDVRPQVYWNYLQRAQDRMALVVRSEGDLDTLTRSVIAEIRAVDPEQPVYDVRTMSAVVDRSVAQQRLTTVVLATFAGVALLMAAIGVYGVVSYGVGQRRREFGIRVALGAAQRDVLLMVLRRGIALAAIGLAIGVGAALFATQALSKLLYGVTARDWLSFAATAAVLAAAALLATILPARRAARVDPMVALRYE